MNYRLAVITCEAENSLIDVSAVTPSGRVINLQL